MPILESILRKLFVQAWFQARTPGLRARLHNSETSLPLTEAHLLHVGTNPQASGQDGLLRRWSLDFLALEV
jgi:hypothetical protein